MPATLYQVASGAGDRILTGSLPAAVPCANVPGLAGHLVQRRRHPCLPCLVCLRGYVTAGPGGSFLPRIAESRRGMSAGTRAA